MIAAAPILGSQLRPREPVVIADGHQPNATESDFGQRVYTCTEFAPPGR